MQIELTPEVEESVMRLVAKGSYPTPSEAVNAALRLFLDPPEIRRRHDELKTMIREGIDAADRGELYDTDEVCDEILAELESDDRRQARVETRSE